MMTSLHLSTLSSLSHSPSFLNLQRRRVQFVATLKSGHPPQRLQGFVLLLLLCSFSLFLSFLIPGSGPLHTGRLWTRRTLVLAAIVFSASASLVSYSVIVLRGRPLRPLNHVEHRASYCSVVLFFLADFILDPHRQNVPLFHLSTRNLSTSCSPRLPIICLFTSTSRPLHCCFIMSGGLSWSGEWPTTSYFAEVQKTSSPLPLPTSDVDFTFQQGFGGASLLSLRSNDSDGRNSFFSLSSPSTQAVAADAADAAVDWEALEMVEKCYWRVVDEKEEEEKAARSSPDGLLPLHDAPAAFYRLSNNSSDEDWVVQSSSFSSSDSTVTVHAPAAPALTSQLQLSLSSPSATSHSTLLTLHGDFVFSARALRQLQGMEKSSSGEGHHASGFCAWGEDMDNRAARGTLIVRDGSSGYTVDWQPNTPNNAVPAALLDQRTWPRAAAVEESKRQAAPFLESRQQQQEQQAVERAAGEPSLPLRTNDKEGRSGSDLRITEESPEPPSGTASTLPRPRTPAVNPSSSCFGSRRGSTVGGRQPLPPLSVAALSTSMPQLASPPGPAAQDRGRSAAKAATSSVLVDGADNVLLRDTLASTTPASAPAGGGVGAARRRAFDMRHIPAPPQQPVHTSSPLNGGDWLHRQKEMRRSTAAAQHPLTPAVFPLPLPLPPAPSLSSAAATPLMPSGKAHHPSWVLLDSDSDAEEEGSLVSATTTMMTVRSLARMVERADAEGGVISLRPVSPSHCHNTHEDASPGNSPALSHHSLQSPLRQRATRKSAAAQKSAESSLDGSRRSRRGSRRRSSASLSHELPLACTAPLQLHSPTSGSRTSSRTNKSTSSTFSADTTVTPRRDPTDSSSVATTADEESSSSNSRCVEDMSTSDAASQRPSRHRPAARRPPLHKRTAPYVDNAATAGRPEKGDAVAEVRFGRPGSASERGANNTEGEAAQGHSSRTDNAERRKKRGMRDAAMAAFPSLPANSTEEEGEADAEMRAAAASSAWEATARPSATTASELAFLSSWAEKQHEGREGGRDDTVPSEVMECTTAVDHHGRPAPPRRTTLAARRKKWLKTPANLVRPRLPYFLGSSPLPEQSLQTAPTAQQQQQQPMKDSGERLACTMMIAPTQLRPLSPPACLTNAHNATAQNLLYSPHKPQQATQQGNTVAAAGKNYEGDSLNCSAHMGGSTPGVSISHSGDHSSVQRSRAVNRRPGRRNSS